MLAHEYKSNETIEVKAQDNSFIPNPIGIIDLRSERLNKQDYEKLFTTVQANKKIGAILWGSIASECGQHKADIEAVLMQNNREYQYHPNDYVHGLLSLASYEENQEGATVANASGWVVNKVFTDKESDYYGVLYENKQQGQLVLAHRGMVCAGKELLKKDSSLNTDIRGIIGGEIVVQQAQAYQAMEYAVTLAQKENYNLSTTGHSLGAWLAELSVYYCHWDFDHKKIKAVTFDSPGSVPMMQKFKTNIESHASSMDIKDFDITSYFSTPNLINSCNGHVGRKIFRLYPSLEPQGWLKKLEKLPGIGKKLGEKIQPVSVLSGHSMILLLEAFDPKTGKPKEYEEVLDWPIAKIATENLGSSAVESALDLVPFSSYVPSFLKTALAKKVSSAAAEYTSLSLLNVIANLVNGNIDMEQYFSLFEYLDKEKGYGLRDDLKTTEKFTVSYQGHYKVRTVQDIKVSLEKDKRVEDYYIAELKEYQKRLLASTRLSANIKRQIEGLLNSYAIKGVGVDATITTQGVTVEALRNQVRRLVELYEDDLNISLGRARRRSSVIATGKLSDNLLERPDCFVGRDRLFKQACNLLEEKQVLVISGFGGSGKSTFALEYCYSEKGKGKIIRWLASETADKLLIDYQNIAEELGISTHGIEIEKVIHTVNSKLNTLGDIILMFDNVEDYDVIRKYLLNLNPRVKVIMTTRRSDILNKNWGMIEMSAFNAKETEAYIQQRLGERVVTIDEIDILRKRIGDLPQRIASVMSFIAEQALDIPEFLMLLDNEEKLMQLDANKAAQLTTAMEIVVGRLAMKDSKAWEMLQYMAHLDPDFGPRPLLSELGFDTIDWVKAKQSLESLSLAKVISPFGLPGFRLHRLVQEDAKAFSIKHGGLELGFLLSNLGEVLKKLFPKVSSNPDVKWRDAKLYFPSVSAIITTLKEVNPLISAQLFDKLGYYHSYITLDFNSALTSFREALAINQVLYSDDHPNIANSLNNVGEIYDVLGDVHNSLEYHKQGLEMRVRLYPNDNLDIAISLNNVGVAYGKLGKVSEGLEYKERALAMRQKLYSSDHPDIASSLLAVGWAYDKLGKVEKSLSYFQQALEMRMKLYSGNHPDIATSLNAVGFAHDKLGNARKGLEYKEQALKMRQALFSGDHIDIAKSLNNIGTIYDTLGNSSKALEYHEQALKMRKALFADDHPDVARSLNNIGIAYLKLGNIKKSLVYYEQALEMRKVLYKGDHPEVAKSLSNIGKAYEALENFKKALEYHEQALKMREVLYKGDHPDIADSLNAIGLMSGHIGNEMQGLKYCEQALEMRKVLYKGDHPDIAKSLYGIGKIYEMLNNTIKSREYHEQALEMRKVLYKDNHPDIADSLSALGIIYGHSSDKIQGVEYCEQALKMRKALFTNEHPDIAKSLNNVGIAYDILGYQSKYNCYQSLKNQVQEMPLYELLSKDVLSMLNKLLFDRVLQKIIFCTIEGHWERKRFMKVGQKGVDKYVNIDYLSKKLKVLDNAINEELALMLCFEAINIGIILSDFKHMDIASNFAQQYPELVKKIAQQYPQFFVHKRIVEHLEPYHNLTGQIMVETKASEEKLVINYCITQYYNLILNDNNIVNLLKFAQHNFGVAGANWLIDIGINSDNYENFQVLRQVLGDELAVSYILGSCAQLPRIGVNLIDTQFIVRDDNILIMKDQLLWQERVAVNDNKGKEMCDNAGYGK